MKTARPQAGFEPPAPEMRATFLTFCDLTAADLLKPYEEFRIFERGYAETRTHHMPAFEDAHAVRALAVGYDLTGKQLYLDACRRWADWAVECQSKMIPAGAYYMNHSRAPGQDKGQWNAADSGTVGMGVLAAAMRDKQNRGKYFNSIRAFLNLMKKNWVAPEGGICNGHWPEYDGPWWCSTATVGKLALLAGHAMDEPAYRNIGVNGARWLAAEDFRQLKPITFEQRPSGTIFYCFDYYIAALRAPTLDAVTRDRILAQFADAIAWLDANQKTRNPAVPDYTVKNVDMAAMPSLMYALARLDHHRYGHLTARADEELRYIRKLLLDGGTPNVSTLPIWEVMTWGMMSYAERLEPGSITTGHVP